jgi:hypothetical protein
MDARDQWCEVHRAKHKKQYHLIDTLNTKLVKSHRNNKNSETRDHGIIQSRELTVNRKLCAQ